MGLSPFAEVLKIALLLLYTMSALPGVSGECKVDQCTLSFVQQNGRFESDNYGYCHSLKNMADCIRNNGRECKGDITYHGSRELVMKEMKRKNCTHILSQTEHHQKSRFPYQSNPMPSTKCYLRPKPLNFSYCGLFGDPHLRTLDGQYMTCKNLGAWPLIDNPYLTVQITNTLVGQARGMMVTGITKIIIFIREYNSCTKERIYEAQSNHLPLMFTDGKDASEPSPNGWIVSGKSNMVEIHIGIIATSIIIRKDGGYLNIAIRIPRGLAEHGFERSPGQLCLAGCVDPERIDQELALASPDRYLRDVIGREPAMSRDEAVSVCQDIGVTDFFFDACVFDLLATGETDFSLAARYAQKDMIKLFPESVEQLNNRMVLSDSVLYSSGFKISPLPIIILVIITVLFS